MKNNIGRTITITSWPGDGVSPQIWMPVFTGKDDGRGEREILRFSRNRELTEDNTYYYYVSLSWVDPLINKSFSVLFYFRVDCRWLMDDNIHYSDMWYDIATEDIPHIPNTWDNRTEGTGRVILYTTKRGDNGLYSSYKIECIRFSTFGFDNFQILVSPVVEEDESNISNPTIVENRREYITTEPSGAGMRELRSFTQLKTFKVGKPVRFNREFPTRNRYSKPETLFAKY